MKTPQPPFSEKRTRDLTQIGGEAKGEEALKELAKRAALMRKPPFKKTSTKEGK